MCSSDGQRNRMSTLLDMNGLLNDMIALGEHGQPENLWSTDAFRRMRKICYTKFPGYQEVLKPARALDEQHLGLLIKGFVLGEYCALKEKHDCFLGHFGSVSVVPPLLYLYVRRYGVEAADELCLWTMPYRLNAYIPFGFSAERAVSAPTLSEYRRRVAAGKKSSVKWKLSTPSKEKNASCFEMRGAENV